jgi:hypothetical protein
MRYIDREFRKDREKARAEYLAQWRDDHRAGLGGSKLV